MHCPKCKLKMKTKVTDSRLQSDLIVRRRRLCCHCGYKFTTWESPMSIDERNVLLRKPQREVSKIKQLAQGIIDRINRNE